MTNITGAPTFQFIASLDDPRVAVYRSLRERNLRQEGLFIAEGALLTERLLRSRFPVESLFVTADYAERFAVLMREAEHDSVPIYVTESALMRQIVGFDFHRGALAAGHRLPLDTAQDLVQRLNLNNTSLQFVACPNTESTENLGLILRSAAAFGASGVLLPEGGADPFSRRCLRQSMGGALTLPTAASPNLLGELCDLRRSCGLRLIAAVADEGENVVPLSAFIWPQRAVLIVGNEYHGLGAEWLDACDYRITIPLAPGCDSLNVAVATGVLLHHLRSQSAR
jgi:tRNA G18 (ribose-2'-O)-methylase SpoU